MVSGSSSTRGRARLLAAALALSAVLPAAASAAVPGEKGEGSLSPPLEELSAPDLASRPPAVQAERLGLPVQGPGSLVREGGRVLVGARLAGAANAASDRLGEAGAAVVGSSARTQTATLAVAPADLAALADLPAVRALWHLREPLSYATTGPCEGGAVISEGLTQLRVDEARDAFELRGRGVTVGVLSDSFDTAREAPDGGPATDAGDDVLSGDLPGPAGSCSGQQLPVAVLDEGPSEEGDEGRAMLQIVHDLAPHAGLAFATAFESEESFAQNIELLARPPAEGGAGAEVVVDDVVWFDEPFFQEGPIAAAVDRVADAGVTYLSAAGNDNLFDSAGNEIASWEAPAFRDSGGCPASIAVDPTLKGAHCMDFDPGPGTDRTFGFALAPGGTLTLDLQWAEPWNGVVTDLDAFLLSGTGEILTASVEENNGGDGTQRPVEVVQWENETSSAQTVRLAVNRFSGASPRLKFILLQSAGVTASEYPQSAGGDVVGPTIFGHAASAGAIAVAAAPFYDSANVEPYSSRGPAVHYFGPVEGAAPAPPLIQPEVAAKPDLTATDCGATTFFAFLAAGAWRFCGTSAAAPHAAAVAALVRQAKPTLPPQQVRDALAAGAVPVGAHPPEAAGAGLVDAFAAIAGLPGPIEGGDGPSALVPPGEPPAPGPTGPAAPGTAGADEATPPAEEPPRLQPPSPVPPQTRILRHPRKLVRTARASVRLVFAFGADQPAASFLCGIDGGRLRPCSRRLIRRFGPGRHVVRAKARSAAGAVDRTAAAFRFRVLALG